MLELQWANENASQAMPQTWTMISRAYLTLATKCYTKTTISQDYLTLAKSVMPKTWTMISRAY